MAHVFSEVTSAATYSDQRLGAETSEAFKRNEQIKQDEAICYKFIEEWRKDESFIYRERVKANYRSRKPELTIDFSDLSAFDKSLSDRLAADPNSLLSLLEKAALKVVAETLIPRPKEEDLRPIHIKIENYGRSESIRALRADHINRLVEVNGIVTSAYKVQSKATKIRIKCATCNDARDLACPKGFGSAAVPRVCSSMVNGSSDTCKMDSFEIVPDECGFIDCQKLRLQELPEDVPTGEIPCHLSLSVDRSLVNVVTAGTRVRVIGIFSVFQPKPRFGKSKKSAPSSVSYLRVVGLEQLSEGMSLQKHPFSVAEEEEMIALSKDPKIYEKLAQSLAPKIYGHEDIKKAIVCLLFGGTKKILPSRSRIRGDINILLLGDPSVAKSQLLKCTEKTAPISVYTSGKGSSAAGLTASVIHNASGDFHLEGGAMVLADGGVVCVDEFDKMREDDRVAIHEAMEQQTISIAKAGITTVLNSRTSVLAAANPTFGRYDDLKKAAENIDFETTILSRFDLIFVIRDRKDPERDDQISKHVLNIHMQKDVDSNPPEIDPLLFTKYIAFCRNRCNPRLSEEAANLLKNKYTSFRIDARKRQEEQGIGVIPITVRQLEAIIRIAEAKAKMELSEIANVKHVKEAIRLFQTATMAAANAEGESDLSLEENSSEFLKSVQRAERHLRRRLPIGTKWSFTRIVNELVIRNHPENAVRRAIHVMRNRGELESSAGGKLLTRKH